MIYTTCGVFFFFKQKTAYEMRISDWSSDVCSSDLLHQVRRARSAASLDRLAHEPAVGRGGSFERLPREGLLLAVVGLEREEAERERIDPALHERVDGEHLTLRLRHLRPAEVEELVVDPQLQDRKSTRLNSSH